MPKLITSDQLSRSRGEVQGLVRAPRNNIGTAIRGVGETLSGEVAAQRRAELQQKEADDALDLTRARSALQVELMRERSNYSYDKDQDYGTWKTRFDEAAPKIHSKVSGLIRNDRLRDRFIADTTPELERYSQDIDGSARDIDNKRKVQEIDLAIDNALEVATAPGTSQATQKQILDDTSASIDGLVKYGTILPEAGAAKKIKFMREFSGRRAKSDVLADPRQAATWLRGEGAVPGALIKKKEDFRETPYYDGPTLRVGYGSDTITLADGSVLPVKAGMRVTREDADRDLKRRMGNYEGDIVKKIGVDAWSKWAPGAQEVLRSIAHNYGTVPDSVIAAAKTGDPAVLAQAIRARAGDKANGVPGGNAKRRYEEAAIVEGDAGKEFAGLNKPVYYDFLGSETKQALLTDAEGELARQDKQRTEASEMERYLIKDRIADDVAQIGATGAATDLTAEQVNAALGPAETAKWIEKRNGAARTFAAVSVMDSMSDTDIDEHLDKLEPKAGTADFKEAQATYDAVEKKANKLKEARIKDPAASVDEHPIVKQAMAQFDPENPASIQGLTKARLAAQDAVGIPPALRQPVTRKEAYRIIVPMQRTFDLWDAELVSAAVNAKGSQPARRQAAKEAQARAEQQIRDIIDEVDKTYGPYAQDVLAFAIAESVRDKEIGGLASAAMRKIANRQPLTKSDMQALDAANETSMAAKAVSGELPAPKASAPPAAGQQPKPFFVGGGRGPRPEMLKQYPAPTQPAVDELIRDPSKAAQFDAIYGPGSAETWLPAR